MAKELSREFLAYQKKSGGMAMPEGGPTPEMIAAMRANPPKPPLPTDIDCEIVTLRGVRCGWARVDDSPKDKVIMYIHGGGFEFAYAEASLEFSAELTRRSRINSMAVEYKALPDHPFPTPIFECAEAYLGLLDMGYKPENIVVTGESAGGCLTGGLPMLLKAVGMPLPGAVAPLSCAFDNFRGQEMKGYANFVDPENPVLAPIYGDLRDYPVTYLSNGTEGIDKIANASALEFKAALEKAGVQVEMDVFEGLGHAPCLELGKYPEADEAAAGLIGFIKKVLKV